MPTVPNQSAGEATEPVPVSRADLLLIIAGNVRAGVAAPVSIEFYEPPYVGGGRFELQLPHGDQAAVDYYAKLFDLPMPKASDWTTTRGLQKVRSYGSQATTPTYTGWQASVHCTVDAAGGRAVGKAHVQIHDMAGATA